MNRLTKSLSIRISAKTLQKLRYIAAYDRRSTGSMVRVLIHNCIEAFEKEHGEISCEPNRERT